MVKFIESAKNHKSKRNKIILIAGIIIALLLSMTAGYMALNSSTVTAKPVTLTDFGITASEMILTNATITTLNVSGQTEYHVVMQKVSISNLVLKKYINGSLYATIKSSMATGLNVTLYATHIYANNTSYTNLIINEQPNFTITASQIIMYNATINATYQKASSFSMSKTNLGFNSPNFILAAYTVKSR
ncbi:MULTISPECIES: hypothetical protein [Acidiplasma]|jgi:hypothetical protein|uniref:Uncharacterized protein n=2 Tax=Acidiplasma cupricumulans TaxID=312540 RepID=A0A0Q0WHE6_9ARCH|nr:MULTISPECIES: hypothetical protein [Acidiplasma]KJE50021.1 hypothetical protein TZ01_02900 [Acidiplasma sp. MBA-1]KQB34928.1 hypothetical protein AOG55_08640 [Acidiplasma cupricumulans]WMT55230.1 MAG: hypothetical protein RE470_00950 [Acidiplasma sp.]